MDKAQALHEFWSGFGWKAYDSSTVPSAEAEALPRITYDVSFSDFDSSVLLTASLWDKSYSWESISKKAEQISDCISFGGRMLPYTGGAIWITRGAPFSQRVEDEDDTIRRILINVNAEFLSA